MGRGRRGDAGEAPASGRPAQPQSPPGQFPCTGPRDWICLSCEGQAPGPAQGHGPWAVGSGAWLARRPVGAAGVPQIPGAEPLPWPLWHLQQQHRGLSSSPQGTKRTSPCGGSRHLYRTGLSPRLPAGHPSSSRQTLPFLQSSRYTNILQARSARAPLPRHADTREALEGCFPRAPFWLPAPAVCLCVCVSACFL